MSWRPFASNVRPAQRWLAVLDTSVLVSAFLSTHEHSGSVKTVEAAIAGVFDCVLSEVIREECRATLSRRDLGSHDPDETDQRFRPLWDRAIWVELSEDSADLHAAVSDPGDVPILRTAMAVFSVRDMGTRAHKFLVTNDTRAFKPGRDWYGFEFLTAHEFHRRLATTK
jgi:predicted nucleic acid-binding protein